MLGTKCLSSCSLLLDLVPQYAQFLLEFSQVEGLLNLLHLTVRAGRHYYSLAITVALWHLSCAFHVLHGARVGDHLKAYILDPGLKHGNLVRQDAHLLRGVPLVCLELLRCDLEVLRHQSVL